jgi:hypothetical protein
MPLKKAITPPRMSIDRQINLTCCAMNEVEQGREPESPRRRLQSGNRVDGACPNHRQHPRSSTGRRAIPLEVSWQAIQARRNQSVRPSAEVAEGNLRYELSSASRVWRSASRDRRGVKSAPLALRTIFCWAPLPYAVGYWRRLLGSARGEFSHSVKSRSK